MACGSLECLVVVVGPDTSLVQDSTVGSAIQEIASRSSTKATKILGPREEAFGIPNKPRSLVRPCYTPFRADGIVLYARNSVVVSSSSGFSSSQF